MNRLSFAYLSHISGIIALAFIIISACSASAAANEPEGNIHDLILSCGHGSPVEINTDDLELAHEKVIEVFENDKAVLAYEATISAPDKRLICTPYLPMKSDCNWRFLVLYQAAASSKVVGYNLSGDEFREVVETLYQVSIYHFDPDNSVSPLL